MNEKILIIEDDEDLAEILKIKLEAKGYRVYTSYKKEEILINILKMNYDLILLDIMLPDFDGVNLCREIRQNVFVPIIFMSAIDDHGKILEAFEAGGDDYVVKPVNYNILFARIDSNIRRNRAYSLSNSFFFRNYELKPHERILLKNGETVNTISATLIGILCLLVENRDKLVTYEQIFRESLFKEGTPEEVRSLSVQMSVLRNKLQATDYIINYRGEGYIFDTTKL